VMGSWAVTETFPAARGYLPLAGLVRVTPVWSAPRAAAGLTLTNRDRILKAIKRAPGSSDRELRERAGITPHQQVNQLTNRLAHQGLTRRVKDAEGIWRNYPVDDGMPASSPPPQPSPALRAEPAAWHLAPVDARSTLVAIPCSGRKRSGGASQEGPSILDQLPSDLADKLRADRRTNATAVNLDEARRLPAWRRYTGHLYEELSPEVTARWETDAHVLIISGGYGVVLAREPIGTYNAVFKVSRWRGGVVSACLAGYAAAHGLDTVIGFTSATTDYAKAVLRADWRTAGVRQAWLVTPVVRGGGAMVRAPRALGQAINAAWRGELSSDWQAADGVGVRLARL